MFSLYGKNTIPYDVISQNSFIIILSEIPKYIMQKVMILAKTIL